jgi:homoserine kinase type II
MAVFTPIKPNELLPWLNDLNINSLHSLEGIISGIENTNYFVDTNCGQFVLTIFEKLNAQELPYYLGLMEHLANNHLPVPRPIANANNGALFSFLHQKPAALVNRLPGQSVSQPNTAQCYAIGEFCAKAHRTAHNFSQYYVNPRGLKWWQATQNAVKPFLPKTLANLLEEEINEQTAFANSKLYHALPEGPVHADLFRDNALFEGDRLGGVIDFYFAGNDKWLFDLAVCVNDWCINHQTGEILQPLAKALLNGYAKVQAFSLDDQQAWPMMLRAAALRFWISRLYDFYLPRPAEMLKPKEPSHFERVLLQRRQGNIPSLN